MKESKEHKEHKALSYPFFSSSQTQPRILDEKEWTKHGMAAERKKADFDDKEQTVAFSFASGSILSVACSSAQL